MFWAKSSGYYVYPKDLTVPFNFNVRLQFKESCVYLSLCKIGEDI